MTKYSVIRTKADKDFFRGLAFTKGTTDSSDLVFDKHVTTVFDDSDFGKQAIAAVCKLLDANGVEYSIHVFKIPD